MGRGAVEYQQVGVHINGVHLKGPAEAGGYNVDTQTIPLLCGGHVTPPVDLGPLYHYHKAPTCDHVETPGEHGPLIGYANDGYGIYGFQDIDGTTPVVDECNGHFGPVSNGKLDEVVYHYHLHKTTTLPSMTFDKQEPSFQPYIIGCQGPSKGKCNTTIAKAPINMTDRGHNWCGGGCGYELCVQPGTSTESLITYLNQFSGKGAQWMSQFTVNNYTICPDCYRNHNSLAATTQNLDEQWQAIVAKRHNEKVCKICTEGMCAKCRHCAELYGSASSSSCAMCESGGCLSGCSDCWLNTHMQSEFVV